MTPSAEEIAAYAKWREEFAGILDGAYYSIEWLDAEFISGRAIIAFCEDAAGLYQIKFYPTGAHDIDGLLCAGSLGAIQEKLVPAMLDVGRSTGAVSVTISSRAGWAKTLKSLGFEPYQATVRKCI